jgi:hypothetical protein
MEQKKEIMSWELRNHLLRQKNRGKDDYLEINYILEGEPWSFSHIWLIQSMMTA